MIATAEGIESQQKQSQCGSIHIIIEPQLNLVVSAMLHELAIQEETSYLARCGFAVKRVIERRIHCFKLS